MRVLFCDHLHQSPESGYPGFDYPLGTRRGRALSRPANRLSDSRGKNRGRRHHRHSISLCGRGDRHILHYARPRPFDHCPSGGAGQSPPPTGYDRPLQILYRSWLPGPYGQKTPGLWQRGFYDHVIRNDADLDAARCYVRNNPVKKQERESIYAEKETTQ